ncbi:MAG TPA: NAD-dependent epimerase/dehydratase family protein [Caulobacteraceae bacterium]|nr:NAD-dependent epimerase/dehydratase family protein [Caulobacteraceae bacterium]
MGRRVLITGGAGFIGRHLARALIQRGDRVRVLDCMLEQVHGGRPIPAELEGAELIVGDVRDESLAAKAVRGVEAVVHLAAEVGVGQSMYAVDRYVSVNDHGAAVLLQQLIAHPVRRIVVASSMSIYGEGLYRSADGALVESATRCAKPGGGGWDPVDAAGRPLEPLPTPETKRAALASVYAISKYVQERLTLTLAANYGMEGVALRLWNVYGRGQALSNPYTGVLAIFAARLANGRRPMLFEDGEQKRDFVHVSDVVRAFLLALDHPGAPGETFNIASGETRTIRQIAELAATALGRPGLAPEITGQMRAGDVRHCLPDLTRAEQRLGYRARVPFAEGLADLAAWVARQDARDRVAEARRELELKGLVA